MEKFIYYNAAEQADMIHVMENIKKSFEALKTELKSMATTVEDNLKGEAARSLKTALETKAAKIEEEAKNWNIVEENAKKIEAALIETDAKVSAFIKLSLK